MTSLSTEQLRKLIEDKRVTIGSSATMRALRAGGLRRVVLASNAAASTVAAVQRAVSLAGVPVDELSVPNDELGVMCKKPFSISLLGIKS